MHSAIPFLPNVLENIVFIFSALRLSLSFFQFANIDIFSYAFYGGLLQFTQKTDKKFWNFWCKVADMKDLQDY